MTLGRKDSHRLNRFDPKEFKLIIIGILELIVDEAHHASAQAYQRILDYFQVYDKLSHIKLWGCSATLRRHDGISLSPTFQKIAYEKSIKELLLGGWLCNITVQTVKTCTNLSDLPVSNGDFSVSHLSKACNNKERNTSIIKLYLDHAIQRRSTLVFAINVEHISHIVDVFRRKGIDARGLHGRTPSAEREELLQDFSRGKFPVLINCGIVTEGVDIPCIDCIILARPTKSGVLLQQMIGRGMRNYAGKSDCLVFDFVDNISTELTTCTIPTLFGLDANSVMQFASIKDLVAIKNTTESTQATIHKLEPESVILTLKTYSDPFNLETIKQDEILSQKLTKYAWNRIGQEKWILSIKETVIILELGNDHIYRASIRILLRKSGKYFKSNGHIKLESPTQTEVNSEAILCHDRLGSAFNALDTYIRLKYPRFVTNQLQWNSSWRKLEMTENQRDLLVKFGLPLDPIPNKGQAADMISRRLNGAKGNSKAPVRRSNQQAVQLS